jgi:hypothetical protein
MCFGLRTRGWVRRLLAASGVTVTMVTAAAAQTTLYNLPPCPPVPCPTPGVMPGVPGMPGTAPGGATETAPGTAPSDGASPFSFAPESSALALSGGSTSLAMAAPGYVDFAVPISQFRLRFDAAYDNNRPDRAEFFYAKCGCFATLPPGNPLRDPRAPGPPLPETKVDYQEIRPYLEYAFNNRFSAFFEAPVRFINPEQNDNTAGIGNLLAGFKYALVACPDQYLTFQFSVAAPTGDADRGLGNNLTSLEPGILWYKQLTDRIGWHNELRDWIPIGGTDFAGNVLRYGTAVSFLAFNTDNFRVYSISELVGWTALGGKEASFDGNVTGASGDTIVNAKGGVRFGFGPLVGPANLSRSDLYIGYGRALTGEVWYKEVVRVEYSLRF